MSTVEEFSKKVAALVAAITEGRNNGDVNDAQWVRLNELAGDVNHAVDRFNNGEGGQMAADSALSTLETAVKAILGTSAPTGGTPVPAPAAPTPPTTPTAPPSGTSKWAPPQATPASPVTPVVPPSSPGMDLESMKLDIASAVKDGVIELLTPMAQVLPSDNMGFLPVASKAELDELDERVKVLETSSKGMSFGGWLSASITTIVVGVIAFWAMTIGQMGDTIKFVAAPFIGVVFGLVAFVIANTITAMRTRSSQNAA